MYMFEYKIVFRNEITAGGQNVLTADLNATMHSASTLGDVRLLDILIIRSESA